MALTQQQQHIVDTVLSSTDDRIIAVNSVAGSGKTSTGDAVIRAYQPKKGFYTAFNKAIVTDSAKRFGKLVEAKTVHALAYRYVRPSKPIEDLNYLSIREDISYDDKAFIIDTLDDFFRSSSVDVYDFVSTKTNNENLQELVPIYAERMLEGKIPPTFNFMLKCLHLMLLHKEVEIDFDLFILDECQDTTAVTLEIFKLINAQRKVMFGDKYQNIYSFMNTVNAFEELQDLNLLRLTKSFRCSSHIAEEVDTFGTTYLDSDFEFLGNDDMIGGKPPSIAYITRSNAALIERMAELIRKKKPFSLTRNINEIFSMPIALLNAATGREVYDKKYKYLEREYKNYKEVSRTYRNFYDYLETIMDNPSIEATARALNNLAGKNINIYEVKKAALVHPTSPDRILTTAHAFKGLEADTVVLEDDLNNSVNRVADNIRELETIFTATDIDTLRDYLSQSDKEDLNTYYVALSRARVHLENVGWR